MHFFHHLPVAVLVLLLPFTNAQFVSSLPQCVQSCITQSTDSNCALTDIKCLCRASAGNFFPDIVTCIHGNCDNSLDNDLLLGPLQLVCQIAGTPIPDSAIRNAESEASSLAAMVTTTVTMRASSAVLTTISPSISSSTPLSSTSTIISTATTSTATSTISTSTSSTSSPSSSSAGSGSTSDRTTALPASTSSSFEEASKTSAAPSEDETNSSPFKDTNNGSERDGVGFLLVVSAVVGAVLGLM